MTQKISNWLSMLDSRYKIYNLYSYGSCVYGTSTEQSDEDYIAISEYIPDTSIETNLSSVGVDIKWYTPKQFQELIDIHEISALECLWLPEQFVHKKTIEFQFNYDSEKLREAISAKASNSWVKFKKKFIVDKDYNPYVGIKSLFHSLRILDFGVQIANYGQIVDYKSMKQVWNETFITFKAIMAMEGDSNIKMNYLKESHQPIYNKLKSKLKEVAFKDKSKKVS